MKGERSERQRFSAKKNISVGRIKPEPPPGPNQTQQDQVNIRLAAIRQKAIEDGHKPVSSSQRRPASP